MPLNLHLLRLFATVARAGSFSRAAELLHISQPSISKSIRDFEKQVGCRLLERGPKGVSLTREGSALARHAIAIFSAERAAEEELSALRNLEEGTLRIGASTTIATYMLPKRLGTFHQAHPNIEIHLVSANTRAVADLMIAREIDIALVEGPVKDRTVSNVPWRKDEMVLIVGAQHELARTPAPIEANSLLSEVLIEREPGSGSREVVNEALSRLAIVPRRRLEIGSTEAIKQAVVAGLGVAIVSAETVRDQVALGTLKIIPVQGVSLVRTLWQLSIPGRFDSPAARFFAASLQEKEGLPQRAVRRLNTTKRAKLPPRT